MGVKLQKSGQICERPECDVDKFALFQLCCQRIGRGGSTPKIRARACPRIDAGNFQASASPEPAHQIVRDPSSVPERGVAICCAQTGDAHLRRMKGQDQRITIIHFADRRADRDIGINPDGRCRGAVRKADEDRTDAKFSHARNLPVANRKGALENQNSDGVLAQLVEHHNGIVGVRGSNPLGSSLCSPSEAEQRLSRRSLGEGGPVRYCQDFGGELRLGRPGTHNRFVFKDTPGNE